MTTGSFWNLPEEITFDILSRLPAKSVGVCRCVSKPWRALLSQPQFIRAHLHMSKSNPQWSVTFSPHEDEDQDLHACFCFASLSNNAHQDQVLDRITLSQIKPLVASDGTSGFVVRCSCDGLLFAMMGGCFCFVLNPTTREAVQLSEVDSPYSQHSTFEPIIIMEAFGYDPVDDDYKVIVVGKGMVVDVYSMRSGCWKRAQTSAYYDSYLDMQDDPVFLHGYLIFVAERIADQMYAIVAFSLAEEKFSEVPPLPCSIYHPHPLCVLDGCLCMFDRIRNAAGIDLWMMKEFGVKESWTKFTINPTEAGMVWDLCSLGEENVLIRYWDTDLKYISSVMYNLKEGSFKYFVLPGSARHVDIRNGFVESLVSPCGW